VSTRPVRIQPSILAADWADMRGELERIRNADQVHVDVMDNHFVPNLTFGPQMVETVQRVSPIPLDVHLMIEDPDRWAPGYAELGAFSVTFHAEAAADPVALARRIRDIGSPPPPPPPPRPRDTGSRPSIPLKPGTAVEPYLEMLPEFDQVLVMTVEPGFGGQSFMPEVMPKLRVLREVADREGLDVWLQVDGGIAADTIGIAAEAGADTFVAGSAVYGAADVDAAIVGLRTAAAHAH